jgi:deferrochelatase/peroxidase EfeB
MTVRRRVLLGGFGAAALAGTAACRATAPAASPPPGAPSESAAIAGTVPSGTLLTAYDVAPEAELPAVMRELHRTLGSAPAIVAVGASLFDARPHLARPRLLTAMPPFPADALDQLWCHGDILVQTYGNQVLTRALPALRQRWQIQGFHPPSPDGAVRNLFGFQEGAGNPSVTDARMMDSLVWVRKGDDEPAWCTGGTYQVVRLIRLATSIWQAETVSQQERVFGRRRDSDVPLTGGSQADVPNYSGDPDGRITPLDSHIRRANPHTSASDAHRILRRGWSYRTADTTGDATDEGQIFTCFQRDLDKGFVTVQRRLAGEALERYTLTFGGGYYFVLPEPTADPADYRGRPLLEQRQP